MLRILSSPKATCNITRAAKSALMTALVTLQVVFDNDKAGWNKIGYFFKVNKPALRYAFKIARFTIALNSGIL
jgi:hypothetical protein